MMRDRSPGWSIGDAGDRHGSLQYSNPVTLRNFCIVMGILVATCAPARARQDPALRERVNRVGSDLFSPTPHPAEAIKELKEILAIAPDSPEAHLLLGVAYRAQGNPDLMGEAVAELRQALALNPELTQARMILARIYLDLARASRARDELQIALEKVPNSPQLLTLMAEAERLLGNPKKAVALSRQVLEMDPKFDQARYYLGLALIDLQQTAAAIEELERVAASGSNPAESNLALGMAYLEARRFDDAMRVLREATKADPSRPEAHIQLARSYRLKGRLDDAARELKLAAPATSGSLSALYQNIETDYFLEQGLLRMTQGNLDTAVQSFEKVLTLDPNHAVAQRSLAEARKRLRERAQKKTPGSSR
jgi:tetratricopeptide (TPR) repeat protein